MIVDSAELSFQEDKDAIFCLLLSVFMSGKFLELSRMILKQITAWLLTFCILSCFASLARADFRVCNSTQGSVGVAIGYRTVTGWSSEGWWQIEATSCKTLIDGPLASRFYYLYAEDADGVGRWSGNVDMCISERAFKIDGVKNCFTRGYQKFGFQEIDTENQASWMVQLSKTSTDSSSLSGNQAVQEQKNDETYP